MAFNFQTIVLLSSTDLPDQHARQRHEDAAAGQPLQPARIRLVRVLLLQRRWQSDEGTRHGGRPPVPGRK